MAKLCGVKKLKRSKLGKFQNSTLEYKTHQKSQSQHNLKVSSF